MFKKIFLKITGQDDKNFGFGACATCTTSHTPTCTKIDNELAEQLGIANDPNRETLLAAAKKAAFNPQLTK